MRRNKRTPEEQLKYLEDLIIDAAEGMRCRVCGDVRQFQDCDKEMNCCDECADYQKLLAREDEEHRAEMYADGHKGIF